jgi:hypothetical protein
MYIAGPSKTPSLYATSSLSPSAKK